MIKDTLKKENLKSYNILNKENLPLRYYFNGKEYEVRYTYRGGLIMIGVKNSNISSDYEIKNQDMPLTKNMK